MTASPRPDASAVPPDGPRATGTVRWYDARHGYGIVAPDDGTPDCLLHRYDFLRGDLQCLARGDRVAFAIVASPQGPWARDLTRAPGAGQALT